MDLGLIGSEGACGNRVSIVPRTAGDITARAAKKRAQRPYDPLTAGRGHPEILSDQGIQWLLPLSGGHKSPRGFALIR